nr:DUF1329 domain-containing protein [Pseudomonas sp. FEMGT703P]
MLCTAVSTAFGSVSAVDAAKLGGGLTPLGAEVAGNLEGTIPEWVGGLPKNAGKTKNGFRDDPFASEKPLFVIDSKNYKQYIDKLSPGQVALFSRYPETFKMPIYASHRTAGLPDFLANDIKENALTANLVEGGNGVQNFKSAIPFPIPQSGLEVIWNHIARYRGGKMKRFTTTIVPQANGQYVPTNNVEVFAYRDQLADYNASESSNILFYYMSQITGPARLAGNVYLVHETLNQVKEPRMAWVYNAGQRRVRRAPQISYDSPGVGSDGMKTSDGLELFNGSPDRYDWKLVGKRELYIPYNSYRAGSPDVDYKTLIQPGHLNPEYLRYELHRVWEVIATLKDGSRHVYAKRHMFIDEDTWTMSTADHYDGRGTLWRVGEAHLQYFYEAQTSFQTPEVIYDLIAGRYAVNSLTNEQPVAYDFSYTSSKKDFTPAALRTMGVR